jgi:hypothetical protein
MVNNTSKKSTRSRNFIYYDKSLTDKQFANGDDLLFEWSTIFTPMM